MGINLWGIGRVYGLDADSFHVHIYSYTYVLATGFIPHVKLTAI